MAIKITLKTIRYLSREPIDRAWVVGAVSALVMTLVLSGLWLFIISHGNRQQQEISRLEQRLVSATNDENLSQQYRLHSNQVNAIYAAMTSRWRQPDLVSAIGDMAQYSKVRIISQEYRSSGNRQGFDYHTIDIKASGDYATSKMFLHKLRHLRGLSTINSLAITRAGVKNDLLLTVQVEVANIKE